MPGIYGGRCTQNALASPERANLPALLRGRSSDGELTTNTASPTEIDMRARSSEKASESSPAKRTSRISIGLCAWNESRRMPAAVESLFRQDIFSSHLAQFEAIEVVLLANACSDDTAAVARRSFDHALAALPDASRVRCKVVETEQGGLAWAINQITHELSDPHADYLLKMDCDVELVEPHVLRSLVDALEANPAAEVACPRCLKHIEVKPRKSLVDRVSIFATGLSKAGAWWVSVAGALYCGRASTLRTIWEPIGMKGTDVYVRDMVVTGNWRYPKARRDERIIRVEHATVLFDAYTALLDMLYHQRRRVIGNVHRDLLHRYFDVHVGVQNASELVRSLNEQDPGWYPKMIQAGLRQGRWWVLPRPWLQWRRLGQLKLSTGVLRWWKLPLVLALEAVDAIAALQANGDFKRQTEQQVWRTGR